MLNLFPCSSYPLYDSLWALFPSFCSLSSRSTFCIAYFGIHLFNSNISLLHFTFCIPPWFNFVCIFSLFFIFFSIFFIFFFFLDPYFLIFGPIYTSFTPFFVPLFVPHLSRVFVPALQTWMLLTQYTEPCHSRLNP